MFFLGLYHVYYSVCLASTAVFLCCTSTFLGYESKICIANHVTYIVVADAVAYQ